MSKDGPIYEKFKVERTDGEHKPGGKHDGCFYFVLDVTHDQHALAALYRYAESCEEEFPQLASSIRESLKEEARRQFFAAQPTSQVGEQESQAGEGENDGS